jgi:hypothetical protein
LDVVGGYLEHFDFGEALLGHGLWLVVCYDVNIGLIWWRSWWWSFLRRDERWDGTIRYVSQRLKGWDWGSKRVRRRWRRRRSCRERWLWFLLIDYNLLLSILRKELAWSPSLIEKSSGLSLYEL